MSTGAVPADRPSANLRPFAASSSDKTYEDSAEHGFEDLATHGPVPDALETHCCFDERAGSFLSPGSTDTAGFRDTAGA